MRTQCIRGPSTDRVTALLFLATVGSALRWPSSFKLQVLRHIQLFLYRTWHGTCTCPRRTRRGLHGEPGSVNTCTSRESSSSTTTRSRGVQWEWT
ncbi:hypothetical protein L227DRAFT_69071 [Lentinus tigrinus ALCF2SS1-6]|uniref:Uncharacterized protein n=1 Tax=Lentinus tigrinus ALCF2SS1-6 TaxID=1328759 RepID=A0A5C2SDV2_9APHY|nr:hypothetical protein L227DRAFT_69071 [Lentinus tigrinus ALCF2SS1-6]